jgi:hypothetical protein
MHYFWFSKSTTMFDNLLQLVKDHAGDTIVNNPAIPNEKNDEAISATTNGIMSQLQNLAGEGGLSNITSLFQSGNIQDHPALSKIGGGVAGNLMEKFGISSQQAGDIVSQLVPAVMSKFVSKTNDPSDNSFDLKDIMSKLNTGNGGATAVLVDKFKDFF